MGIYRWMKLIMKALFQLISQMEDLILESADAKIG